MTEAEWMACTDPPRMLDYLGNGTTDRKLRLFGCACCRRGTLDYPGVFRAITVVESYVDGLAPRCDLRAARRAFDASPAMQETRLARCLLHEGPPYLTRLILRIQIKQPEFAPVVRHIWRNPCHACLPASPWPSAVVQLADAVYHGEAGSDALHDALLEARRPDFAEHFREAEHPKGCWALDAILGKK